MEMNEWAASAVVASKALFIEGRMRNLHLIIFC
jgi:hypothetical protein